MKVLYVYDGHWPFQATRAIKQSDVLLAAGHEVMMLSRGSAGAPREERNGKLSVSRLPSMESKLLDRIVNYPVFLNPVWLRHIRRHVRTMKPDCIIVGDLPLAPAAVIASGGRIPVHYDMAEVYPVGLASVAPHESSVPLKMVRATGFAFALERWVLKRVATTFVVSEDSRERVHSLGVDPSRVVLVGNTPANADAIRRDWDPPADIADIVAAKRPSAIFVGNIYADRGLRFAIEGMHEVIREVPKAMLVVVGEGRERIPLQELAAREGLNDYVRFVGWKHHNDHPAYLRYAQVGLLPFVETEHIRITLANKLFDYMAAGIPIVASDVPSMRRVIDETKTGILVPASDKQALGRAMITLFKDDALRAEMGRHGVAAIDDKYDWNKDAQRFLDAIYKATPA